MGFFEWVQRRLLAHDFNPGPVDGIWGRRTRNATVAFQTSKGLSPNGILNNATVAALRATPTGTEIPSHEAPSRDLLDYFPWMMLALRKKGLHENDDNRDLRAFLKSDGKTLGDPARLPWCGDFVETCIALTLPNAVLPTNPYLARNWQRFGRVVSPCFGSILVFWRGSIGGISGHVGFYYSENATHFQVLGGNQSNKIGISSIEKRRLLSAQMPDVGGPYPQKVVTGSGDFQITENEF